MPKEKNVGKRIKMFRDKLKMTLGDLAAKSGMDEKQVLAILASIAPALLTGISAAAKSAAKKKKQGFDLSDGLDFTDIAALFGGIEETKPKGRKSKNDGTALLGALLGLK